MTHAATTPSDTFSRFTVTCPADKTHLGMLRRFVVGVAEEAGFTGEALYQIEMAVDEACSNAMVHAYGASAPAPQAVIELHLSLDPEALSVEVRDRGQGGLSGEAACREALEAYHDPAREHYCGLGLLIVKQFMDEVRVASPPEKGTRVTMRKYRRAAPPSAEGAPATTPIHPQGAAL